MRRPLSVAHGGQSSPTAVATKIHAPVEGAHHRHRTERSVVGACYRELNDRLSAKHERSAVGSQVGIANREFSELRRGIIGWTERSYRMIVHDHSVVACRSAAGNRGGHGAERRFPVCSVMGVEGPEGVGESISLIVLVRVGGIPW